MATDFIYQQLQASERLFNMMKEDHKTRMAEIEHWANVTKSLLHKIEERDETIVRLRSEHAPLEVQEEMNAMTRRLKVYELQMEHLSDEINKLRDQNAALRLDLGLKDLGLGK